MYAMIAAFFKVKAEKAEDRIKALEAELENLKDKNLNMKFVLDTDNDFKKQIAEKYGELEKALRWCHNHGTFDKMRSKKKADWCYADWLNESLAAALLTLSSSSSTCNVFNRLRSRF